jgi:hypothetical protein
MQWSFLESTQVNDVDPNWKILLMVEGDKKKHVIQGGAALWQVID